MSTNEDEGATARICSGRGPRSAPATDGSPPIPPVPAPAAVAAAAAAAAVAVFSHFLR